VVNEAIYLRPGSFRQDQGLREPGKSRTRRFVAASPRTLGEVAASAQDAGRMWRSLRICVAWNSDYSKSRVNSSATLYGVIQNWHQFISIAASPALSASAAT
jgi:hypothetical protein